jgi:hypothetical protein
MIHEAKKTAKLIITLLQIKTLKLNQQFLQKRIEKTQTSKPNALETTFIGALWSFLSAVSKLKFFKIIKKNSFLRNIEKSR